MLESKKCPILVIHLKMIIWTCSEPSDFRSLGCSTYGNGLLWSFSSTTVQPKVYSPIMARNTRIFIQNTRILSLKTRNNLKGCVLPEPKNTHSQDKKKHKVRAKCFSQSSSSEEDQSSVPVKSLLSPKRLLLSKTNNKITQTQSFTGR